MNPILPFYAVLDATPKPAEALRRRSRHCLWRKLVGPLARAACLAVLVSSLSSAPLTARAGTVPPGCTGSGLGISLFTSSPDVHLGDTLKFSVGVYNGIPGGERAVCDATGIAAGIVTPDGRTNMIPLMRTTLHAGEGDFYNDVVSYVVRAQDLLPDGTVPARAFIDGNIDRSNADGRGGWQLEVKTEVRQPCIQITADCAEGALQFTGTVRNCGNAPLNSVTVSNLAGGGAVRVIGPLALAIGQSVTFRGEWAPAGPPSMSTAVLVVTGSDNLTFPRTVTAQARCTLPVNASAAAPSITSVTLTDGVATVIWASIPGVTYTLQCKSSLADPFWTDIPGTVTAGGTSAIKTEVPRPDTHRFYRVVSVESTAAAASQRPGSKAWAGP